MKKFPYALLLLFFLACDTQTTEEKIQNLNGYWAISQVEMANGEIRQYPEFNALVDYIKINDNHKGFRKKVKPQLDGSYLVTNDLEKIQVKVENDTIRLYYSTEMDKWTEILVVSEENKIVLKNEYGKKYTYKRFSGYLNQNHGKNE